MSDATGAHKSARAARGSGLRGIFSVPTLEELKGDPSKAWELDAHTARVLTTTALLALNALHWRQLELFDESAGPPTGNRRNDDCTGRWIKAAEAAEIISESPRWLYRNAHRLPFVRRVSRKRILIDRIELDRWISARRP